MVVQMPPRPRGLSKRDQQVRATVGSNIRRVREARRVSIEVLAEAIEVSVAQIVDTIKDTIEETPPELVADIMDQGIVLAGGGALLAGLDKRVAEATQMPVHIADDPLTCVVRGTGRVLEDLDTLERVLVSEQFTRAPR